MSLAVAMTASNFPSPVLKRATISSIFSVTPFRASTDEAETFMSAAISWLRALMLFTFWVTSLLLVESSSMAAAILMSWSLAVSKSTIMCSKFSVAAVTTRSVSLA